MLALVRLLAERAVCPVQHEEALQGRDVLRREDLQLAGRKLRSERHTVEHPGPKARCRITAGGPDSTWIERAATHHRSDGSRAALPTCAGMTFSSAPLTR